MNLITINSPVDTIRRDTKMSDLEKIKALSALYFKHQNDLTDSDVALIMCTIDRVACSA